MNFLNNPSFPPPLELIWGREEFDGTGATAGVIGSLGWQLGGGPTIALKGNEEGHIGIFNIARASGATAWMHLNWLDGQGVAWANGLTIETVIRIPSLASFATGFGLSAAGGLTAGRKRWLYDSAVSPNWLLSHQTAGGSAVNVDSGIAAVTGWQRLILTFNGATTVGTVRTSTSVGATVTNDSAVSTTTSSHCFCYDITSGSGTKGIDIDAFQYFGQTSRF